VEHAKRVNVAANDMGAGMRRLTDATPTRGETVVEDTPTRRSRTSGIDRMLQMMDLHHATERATTALEIPRSVKAALSTIYTLIDELVERQLLDRQSDCACP
jgi:hypothetical protein